MMGKEKGETKLALDWNEHLGPIDDVTGSEIDDGRGWTDYTIDRKGRVVQKRLGPGFLWLVINQVLKLFTCGLLALAWVTIGMILGIKGNWLAIFAFATSYVHLILSKFIFQWP